MRCIEIWWNWFVDECKKWLTLTWDVLKSDVPLKFVVFVID